jgi:glycosyltransferase involved in cell wall biosynthesis
MRKVLFISLMNGAPWGGSELMWFRLAQWMAKEGHVVAACVYDWKGNASRFEQLALAGCQLFRLPLKKGFFYQKQLRRTLSSIPFEEFDLVIVNQGGYKEVVYPPFDTLWTRCKRYILFHHNYDVSEKLSKSKTASLKEWCTHASLQVAASHKIFYFLDNLIGVTGGNREVWPNPIGFDIPIAVSPQPPMVDGNYVFVILAELDIYRKAQDLVIKVLSQSKWRKRNWKLHIYGAGKDEKQLEKIIRQESIEEKIIIKKYTSNVKAVLNSSHILLHCSRIDAMPLSVVEAMSMSRPCIVSNVGDMPLWVIDSESGFVCPQLTAESVDSTLERCWNERENWDAIGRRAFGQFLKRYPDPYEMQIATKALTI